MAKPDFPALLVPGMHTLTLQDLQALAVTPFGTDVQRHDLFQKLASWTAALQAAGVQASLWLDGSFLTEKPGPGDIDCVLWNPHWIDQSQVTTDRHQLVTHLLDRTVAETLYGLDLYIVAAQADDLFHREAYWRGVLGFAHDRVTAKGFAEIHL